MGDNECLSLDPTGICYGDPEKSQQSIIDLNQVRDIKHMKNPMKENCKKTL